MKPAVLIWLALLVLSVMAQDTSIRTTVPLVVIPVSVTDRTGHSVDSLTASDFLVLDDGQPRTVRLDTSDDALAPVSLVVAIQLSDLSSSAIAKIRKIGAMITQAVAGENGEVAVITFDDQIKMATDFTKDANTIADLFRDLKSADNGGGRMIDALEKASKSSQAVLDLGDQTSSSSVKREIEAARAN